MIIVLKTIVTILIILLLFIGVAIATTLLCAGLFRICLWICEWIEMIIYGRNK